MVWHGTLEGKLHPVGFRVVTEDMRSLGLRRNPNILTYPVGEWFCLPRAQIKRDEGDWGGIWVAISVSGARRLQEYMQENYDCETRIFLAYLRDVLHVAGNYRIKTSGVYLADEIKEGDMRELSRTYDLRNNIKPQYQ